VDEYLAGLDRVAAWVEHGNDETPAGEVRRLRLVTKRATDAEDREGVALLRLERVWDLVSHREADETVRVPAVIAALQWTPDGPARAAESDVEPRTGVDGGTGVAEVAEEPSGPLAVVPLRAYLDGGE
jgi:hypothetical protein